MSSDPSVVGVILFSRAAMMTHCLTCRFPLTYILMYFES